MIAQPSARITPKPLPHGGHEGLQVLGETADSPCSEGANSQLSSSPVSHSLPSKTKEGLCQISGWGVSMNPLTTVPVAPAVFPAIHSRQCWGGLFVFPPPLALG